METLTKLSARSLEYYINAGRWENELDFFNLEVLFMTRLVEDHFLQLAGEDRVRKLTQLGSKLSDLMNEKHRVKESLTHQLRDLELMAQDLLNEIQEELAGKQAHLEYQMMNLIHDYRAVKTELYAILESCIE